MRFLGSAAVALIILVQVMSVKVRERGIMAQAPQVPTPFWCHAQSRNRIETSRPDPLAAFGELAGKFLDSRNAGLKIKAAMMQVEAVLQMWQPGFNVASIAANCRNKSNPWFKRGTLFMSAVDVLRRAGAPMTAREIAEALIAGKAAPATQKQSVDMQTSVLAALRKRDGVTVIGEGAPARWRLRRLEESDN